MAIENGGRLNIITFFKVSSLMTNNNYYALVEHTILSFETNNYNSVQQKCWLQVRLLRKRGRDENETYSSKDILYRCENPEKRTLETIEPKDTLIPAKRKTRSP